MSEIETAVAIRRDAQRQRIWLLAFGVLFAPFATDGFRQHFVQGLLCQRTAFDHHERRVVAFEIAVGDIVASGFQRPFAGLQTQFVAITVILRRRIDGFQFGERFEFADAAHQCLELFCLAGHFRFICQVLIGTSATTAIIAAAWCRTALASRHDLSDSAAAECGLPFRDFDFHIVADGCKWHEHDRSVRQTPHAVAAVGYIHDDDTRIFHRFFSLKRVYSRFLI